MKLTIISSKTTNWSNALSTLTAEYINNKIPQPFDDASIYFTFGITSILRKTAKKMTEKELENIISYLEEHHKKETALFGFYHQDGDEYNTCIKANEQGLSLFSSELLKAILKVRNQKIKKDTVEYIDLELDWTDPNANYFFENIILTKELKTANQQIIPEEKQTWKDRFYGFLIFSSILLLIAMLLIGFFTTIKWIF